MLSYLFDLIIYVSIFLLSYFFILLSRKCRRPLNVYFIISILFLCLFATFRNYDIGTDTVNYLAFFNQAQGKSFVNLMQMQTFSEMEVGYDFLLWLSANYFHSYRALLFICALLTVVPIYTVVQKMEEKSAAFLACFTFLFVFWGMSLNVTRQSIASAFFLLAVTLWENKKWIKAIIAVLCAVLFHYGVLFGVLMIIVPYLITKIKNVHVQNLLFVCAIIILSSLAGAWDVFLQGVLKNTGGVLHSYTRYITKFKTRSTYLSNVSLDHYIDFVVRIIFVLTPILILKGHINPLFTRNNNQYVELPDNNESLKQQERRLIYLSIETLFVDAFCLFVLGTMYGYRIVMCADFLMILTYANIARIRGYKKSNSFGKVNIEVFAIMLILNGSFFIRYIWLHMHGIAGLIHKIF